MEPILVINAGSSSVKFQVFAIDGSDDLTLQIKGQVDGIGTQPRLHARAPGGRVAVDRRFERDQVRDVASALQTSAAWLREQHDIVPVAVGHRVVHGGPDYDKPVLVNGDVLSTLEQYVALAPLHQPNNLAPIRTLLAHYPDLPQVACFDTAFHRGHGALADHYALPLQLYAQGVRRYGFHGLSYEYVAQRLPQIAPDIASGRVIVAHLGSGASMCALAGGRSIESTMGFTALDGLPMGTRPGQLDPGVVLFLIDQMGMSAAAVQQLFYHDSGLKGLSGVSNDVRELEASPDPRAAFALEYFAYRVGLHAGTLAAALGGLDAFVFTAGIGENSVSMRARIAEKLAWLGAALDQEANAAHAPLISRGDSRVALHVIPTDEELMIARHTLALLSGRDQVRSPAMRASP
jgi:acetate kinase